MEKHCCSQLHTDSMKFCGTTLLFQTSQRISEILWSNIVVLTSQTISEIFVITLFSQRISETLWYKASHRMGEILWYNIVILNFTKNQWNSLVPTMLFLTSQRISEILWYNVISSFTQNRWNSLVQHGCSELHKESVKLFSTNSVVPNFTKNQWNSSVPTVLFLTSQRISETLRYQQCCS